MKYKKGDKVVIRKDLVVGEFYGEWGWRIGKDFLKELDYVVIDFVVDGHYVVENGRYITDEMISHKYREKGEFNMNVKYQEGDKVVIRKDLELAKEYGKDAWVEGMKHLANEPYVTIGYALSEGHYSVVDTNYRITDEMISHKYEDSKYVWYFEERGETYFLTKKALIRASSRKHLQKLLDGEVDGTLITEEEAKQSTFFHFGILNKHTPPPKEQLYYVCVPTSTGNLYINHSTVEDVYYAGSIIEDNYHRTKFTEEEANKIIGTSTVLYKKEA